MKSSGNAAHDQSAPSGKRTAQAKPLGKRLRGLRGDKSGTEDLAAAIKGSPHNGAWAWLRGLNPTLAVNQLSSELGIPSAVGSAGLVATAATANAASNAAPAAPTPDGATASLNPGAVLFDLNAPSPSLLGSHRSPAPQSSPPLQGPRSALFAATAPTTTPIAAWEASWRAAETNITIATGGAGDNPNPVLFTPTNTAAAPLAAPTSNNAIVLENQKPGTPESVWMIGTADTTIEGFADQFSIDHGQTENFKINTDSKNYRIDIYRVGYYGGDGARLITTINRNLSTAQVQPVPIFDPTTREVDAGNWSVSASWAIPADAVSGVYFALLTRLDGSGGENMIPFVVRDDEAPSDITFQTSDTTWQAYNAWGGYSFYGGKDAGGIAGRAYALSYNRPITTRDGGFAAGPQDFLFGEEYPAIRWLEENGYDVNYISGIDSARSGAQLLNSKVFLSVGHDEYWSADQRANVTAARNAGVNLAFLSGNEDYWQTRWAPSIDGTNTPYKTLVSYKERWANANIDTQGTTSTWRDFQLGAGQPENALSGTMFTVDAYRLDTMQIPYALSKLRFWTNTAVANLQPGQVYSLTPNLLGYEWESDLNNGFRPAGLIDLSSTTVNVDTKLLDYGTTVGAGTSTHSLTLYRAPSGALVFSAGSVYWSWGLDSHHDNEITPTDPNVQQAMVNLFADMGVQPATLMQSLAVAQQSTDHTAPTSIITSPTASGSYTAGTPITITGTATDSGGGVVADVEVSTNGGASWDRATGYGNWTYNWVPLAGGSYTIESRAVDDSVNLETPSAGTTITVAPGAVTSLFRTTDVPAITTDSDTGLVNLGVKFTSSTAGTIVGLRYYKGLGDGGEHVGSIWSATGSLLASATFTQETASGWQTVTFSNPITVTAGTTYVASYHSNGGYANTDNYFATAHTNGPLTAPSGNGYFTYSSGNAFPTTGSNGTNYWIDVLFSPTSTANHPPVANDDGGFVDPKNTPMVFTQSALLANDTDPDGDPLTVTGATSPSGGTVSFDSQTNAITFTPTTGYVGPGSFVYSISDGRGGVSSATVSMAIGAVTLFAASDTPAVLSDVDASQVTLGVQFVSSQAGTISGLRYYKGAGDTGTHVGSLWTSTGTLLASATYTNETASGWQTVTFSSPVSITAGTTYVASYHSNGHYTDTGSYFTTAHVSGPLTAPTGNGVYTYGSGNLFPTSTFNAANYWADVIFNPAVQGPNQPPVANNDSGFSTLENTALQIATASVLANDTDPNGDALTVTGVSAPTNGTVAFDAPTNTITFTPTTNYTGSAGFTYSISDGNGGVASASVALTVVAPPSGVSLFAANATPATVTVNDPNAVELGMKFTVSANGTITGMRFYKGPQNTGTHTGELWTSAGALLGSLTFSNETASGWQVATFASPISVTAGTTYVISYHTNTGFYSANSNYFSGSVTNGPITAPSSATSGGNGVYAYSAGQAFPTSTYNASNYWVDVVYQQGTSANQPPVANNDSGYSTPENTALNIAAASVLANDTDPNGDVLTVTGVSAPTNGTVAFNASTNTITFTPTTSYVGSAGFTYAISDGHGGTASANVALTVTNQPPVANNDSGYSTPENTALQITAASVLANDTDPNGDLLTVTGVSAPTNGTVAFNASTNTITFTPTTSYVGSAGFTYAISDGHGGIASANVALSVTNQAPVARNDSGYSTPENTALQITAASVLANDTDPNGDTLTVTGVSAPTHGTVAFNASTNTITFTPTTSYVGSAGFTYAISDGHGGTASASVALSVTNQPPVANNDSGFTTPEDTALKITAASVLANDTDPNGDTLTVTGVSAPTHGTVAYNTSTRVITFTPTAGYAGSAGFTYSISDGHGGTASASVALSVAAGASLFAPSATPATITVNDSRAIELGMKFTPSVNGTIAGIRFYKGPSNTGTHTGSLWTSTGTLLGSLTFTNETASGWQDAAFASPIAVTAGTTYVVGYHSRGFYSQSTNYFTSSVTNGPLTAPSSASSGGNGVYAYGSGSPFPTNTLNATNYWVDVVFNGQIAA